jgi:hypothetical protein
MDEEAFLSVVRKIPPTWTCVECKREFDNGPGGEMPWAVRTEVVKQNGGAILPPTKRVIVGNLCKPCAEGPPHPEAEP